MLNMKKKFIEIALDELEKIEGFNILIEVGIDEIISYLYDSEDEKLDAFEFEQNILYYLDCQNELERKQVEIAADKMYPHYEI